MPEAYICDAIRTSFGRYGGVLSSIRTDDLAALPIKALMERNPSVEWLALDDVIYGCANQAGEDNRNVARMALLLGGLPQQVPGATVNRLCGSSMEAVAQAARAIRSGEAELVIAGGVESMSRSPFVMAKADAAFSRAAKMEDTTLGWRFVNPLMKERYGVECRRESRRRSRIAKSLGIGSEEVRPEAARANRGFCCCRSRAAHHGNRAGACNP